MFSEEYNAQAMDAGGGDFDSGIHLVYDSMCRFA